MPTVIVTLNVLHSTLQRVSKLVREGRRLSAAEPTASVSCVTYRLVSVGVA